MLLRILSNWLGYLVPATPCTLNHLIFGTPSGKWGRWFSLRVNLTRLWCTDMWPNSSLDIAVKVFFRYNPHWNQWTWVKQIILHNVVGLINPLKAFREKDRSPEEGGILPLDCLWTPAATSTLSWVSSLPDSLQISDLKPPESHEPIP